MSHLRIKQNVSCRGRTFDAHDIVPLAELSSDQIADLILNEFAVRHTPEATADSGPTDGAVETAEAAPMTAQATGRRSRVKRTLA